MRDYSIGLLALGMVCGCSKVLGYDDLSFGPQPASSGTEAGITDGAVDSFADVVGDTAGKDAQNDTGKFDASSCSGVSCSGQGTCTLGDGGQALCSCKAGYHAEALACVPDETCAGHTCGSCGTCGVLGGKAVCNCPANYTFNGVDCRPTIDPCSPNPCDSDHACVPEAHCMVLGTCVAICDCSNCGNCGSDNSDGRWNDMQEYCGNLNSSPATASCTRPCAPGEGCIPYSPQICWPMEGCLSL